MAKGTVLGNRCMLPEIRATLFGVTLITSAVYRLANQLQFGSFPMRAVTTAAIHLAFKKRMRKSFKCFASLQLMAGVTDIWLRRCLHYSVAWCMAYMATGAGNFVIVVRSTVPAEADIGIVATQAHIILDTDFGFLMRTKPDHRRALPAAPYARRVCAAGSVARFALQLSVPKRAARIGGHRVFGTKNRHR